MRESLRALMDGAIGYAGLFPPAELDLDSAIRDYAAHRSGEDRWMLDDFIVPIGRLDDLAPYREVQFRGGPPWEFIVLPRGGETASLAGSLRDDLLAIDEFHGRHDGRAHVNALELRLPAAVAEDEEECARWMDLLAEATEGRKLRIFVEPVRGDGWDSAIAHAARGLARIREKATGPSFGMKLRCGGVLPSAFPSLEQVAHFILQCHHRQVPFKATAGLHHPLRHRHESLGVEAHGFINVFAGALLVTTGLKEPGLLSLLDERHPEAFLWEDERLTWSGRTISTQQIRDLRKERVSTFGSCRFDEPCDDLRRLGWA